MDKLLRDIQLNGEVCLPTKIAISIILAVVISFMALSIHFHRKSLHSKKEKRKQPVVVEKEAIAEPILETNTPVEENCDVHDKFGMLDAPYKMVLCVNMSLKMEKGKIAAQCGHATLACYKKSLKVAPAAITWWERLGQAKIALKINDEADMVAIQEKAKLMGLVTYIVEDAGRTQIAAGSRTVLGIGPAPVKVLDSITSHLKLL